MPRSKPTPPSKDASPFERRAYENARYRYEWYDLGRKLAPFALIGALVLVAELIPAGGYSSTPAAPHGAPSWSREVPVPLERPVAQTPTGDVSPAATDTGSRPTITRKPTSHSYASPTAAAVRRSYGDGAVISFACTAGSTLRAVVRDSDGIDLDGTHATVRVPDAPDVELFDNRAADRVNVTGSDFDGHYVRRDDVWHTIGTVGGCALNAAPTTGGMRIVLAPAS